jgi:hypothetical protein
MNELDKKIAELKGFYNACEVTEFECQSCGYEIKAIRDKDYKHIGGAWSTSDERAFELVDELTLPANNRLTEFDFVLGLAIRKPWTWVACFTTITGFQLKDQYRGEGITRPEAICRAYIAAMEYMKDKR